MSFFTPVENSHVLLKNKGVYKEAPIYKYDNVLYAKLGTSFVRLKPNNATSVDKQFWEMIDIDPAEGTLAFETFSAVLKPARKPRLAKAA